MGIFNYWETDVMLNNLKGNDLKVFTAKHKEIEQDYEESKEEVINEIKEKLVDCKLEVNGP